jgi:hypothetical protein
MACGSKEAGVYRPRYPQQSPFYRLVERFFPEFEAVYAERYQERYGFWRPIIGTVVRKFLECGDLKHGFARVRCPKCREEFLVPYSCRGRCFCPSCLPGRSFSEGRPPETGAGEGWLGGRICLRRGAAPAVCVHDPEAAADLPQAGGCRLQAVGLPGMRDPTKLRAFELADQLAICVYQATSSFPRAEMFGLNPAPFPLEQPHPSGHAPTTRKKQIPMS